MEMNGLMQEAYDELLEYFVKEDAVTSIIYQLNSDLHNALHWVNYWAKTDEEKAFARECELRAIDYYQKSLECNYDRLRKYKETGDQNISGFWSLVMTVDQDENPRMTRVVDVQKGSPVFADGCKMQKLGDNRTHIDNLTGELRRWLDYSGTLYERLEQALKLKEQGILGISNPPIPSYDSEGMTREQSESNAWRNYAIENGMIGATNYDSALDELIVELKKCIERYEKALSII